MRNRTITVKAMLNKKEKAYLDKQLTVSGLTKSDFLRSLIMDVDIRPKPPDEIIKTYKLVSNLTNNANQIARVANCTGYINPEQIEGLLIMVDKCWEQIKKIS